MYLLYRNISPGTYTVIISKEGYMSKTLLIDLTNQNMTLDGTLEAETRIGINVTGEVHKKYPGDPGDCLLHIDNKPTAFTLTKLYSRCYYYIC